MADKVFLYNVYWQPAVLPIVREMDCIRMGGRWKKSNGQWAGRGLFYHMRELQKLLWPEKMWHRWNELELICYLKYRVIGEIGPASSGKTMSVSTNVLADYYCFPYETTVLASSTTRESLEMRIWGEIKKFHRLAKSRVPWLPGHLIEGRQRIVTSPKSESVEGRDFRNGLVGIACKKGQNFQGLGEYVGIKNKRVRLAGDELHFMPKAYVDAIANLNKNPDFKCVGLGNPKDIMDALGILCEPSGTLGGWESGIDQTPRTKTWPTRFDQGICIQLPGSDSPNLDGKLGIPLISQKDIDADIAFYGKDSLQYTMMDEGRMPRGQSSRRVISRQLCEKFKAMEPPIWLDTQQTAIGFLDAAYRGVGGDRCVFGELRFGRDVDRKNILALIETMIVPIVGGAEPAEDQIATFVRRECEARRIAPENFGFDSTGRGTLMAAFARSWSPNVVPVEFGGTPTDRPVSNGIDVICRDYYSKFVTELWFTVRLVVEAGQFRGMTEDMLNEGSMREWTIVGKNKIEVEPKPKMKLKTGRSPDLFDALATGVEVARRRGFNVERITSTLTRRDDGWKKQLKERMKAVRERHQLNYRA